MKFTVLDNGNLGITATEEERESIKGLVKEGVMSYEDAFVAEDNHLGGYQNNGWLVTSNLSELGHMTESPAIADNPVIYQDPDKHNGIMYGIDSNTSLWVDNNYMVHSFVEDLVDTGKAILTKVDTSEWGKYDEESDTIVDEKEENNKVDEILSKIKTLSNSELQEVVKLIEKKGNDINNLMRVAYASEESARNALEENGLNPDDYEIKKIEACGKDDFEEIGVGGYCEKKIVYLISK